MVGTLGTLVTFNRWIDDENGRRYEGTERRGYVIARDDVMGTVRVFVGAGLFVGPGDYYTVRTGDVR